MYVNLLPRSFQRDLVIRQRLLQWGSICALTGIAMLLLCGVEFASLVLQRRLLAAIELESEPAKHLQEQLIQIEQQLTKSKSEYSLFSGLITDHRALGALAIVSRAVQGVEGQVQILNFQFHCPQTFSSIRTDKTPQPNSSGYVQLQGIADNDAAVAALVDALRQVPVIKQAELKSSSHWTVAGSEERKFEIHCKL